MKKKVLMLGLLSLALIDAHAAGNSWSLDSLRAKAISNNKALLMAGQKKVAASYTRKSAATNYLPKVSATGAYMYTSRELSLLSDEQKTSLSNIGTGLSAVVPNLAPMSSAINTAGQGVVDALHTDTRNAGVVAVMLTQPIYMGGKIRAYNKITQYAEEAAGTLYDKELQDIIVDVDEAYWNLVALYSKKKLAEGYKALVDKLEGDVEKLVKEGMATKADLLSVKVKVNEAGVSLIQVNNGIELSRMNLCPNLWTRNERTRRSGGCHRRKESECQHHGSGRYGQLKVRPPGAAGRKQPQGTAGPGTPEPDLRREDQSGTCRISAKGGADGRLSSQQPFGVQQLRAQAERHVERGHHPECTHPYLGRPILQGEKCQGRSPDAPV